MNVLFSINVLHFMLYQNSYKKSSHLHFFMPVFFSDQKISLLILLKCYQGVVGARRLKLEFPYEPSMEINIKSNEDDEMFEIIPS